MVLPEVRHIRKTDYTRAATISMTCFIDQANSLTRDCNEVLAEIADKDPYRLPSSLKDLESTTHTFQFDFDIGSTSERPDFISDRAFKNATLPLPTPPAQKHTPATATEEQPQQTQTPTPISLALPLSLRMLEEEKRKPGEILNLQLKDNTK
ncbi:hypothetical protein Tco_0671585 [Tanacetum coccineum]